MQIDRTRRPASAPPLTNGRAPNSPRQPGDDGAPGRAAEARQPSEPVRETGAPRPLPWSRRGPASLPRAPLSPGSGAGRHPLTTPLIQAYPCLLPAASQPPAVTEPSLDNAVPVLPERPARPQPALTAPPAELSPPL